MSSSYTLAGRCALNIAMTFGLICFGFGYVQETMIPFSPGTCYIVNIKPSIWHFFQSLPWFVERGMFVYNT